MVVLRKAERAADRSLSDKRSNILTIGIRISAAGRQHSHLSVGLQVAKRRVSCFAWFLATEGRLAAKQNRGGTIAFHIHRDGRQI